MADQDFVTFGPVHLEVRDPARTARFWQQLAGFEQRTHQGDGIEVGTADETLLVLHGGAQECYLPGHSGIFHVAIHAPDARDFARMLRRFRGLQYPIRPSDHTFSKAIYLADPDGIHYEFVLETPERFKTARLLGDQLVFLGTDGVERSAGYPLDLDEVLRAYEAGSENEPAARGTKVGHVHLHVRDLEEARSFYEGLGWELARWWPPLGAADLGAGGPFKHRLAINTWQGVGTPPSPAGSARMRHFELRFDSPKRLQTALAANPMAVEDGNAYKITDPSGIDLRLSKAPAQTT